MDHLANFIKQNGALQSIVFCSTKYRTRDVAHDLRKMDFNSVAIEGDMSQHRREQSMTKFRSGKADILVATDVASRGIDVPHVGLVVNYDVPNQELTYFHRIGRTARAGGQGDNACILLVCASFFVFSGLIGCHNMPAVQVQILL